MSTTRTVQGKRRYLAVVWSTASKFKRGERVIIAADPGAAAGKAQAWLRLRRLTEHDGASWDRWTLKTAGSPHVAPEVIAWGAHDTVIWHDKAAERLAQAHG